MPILDSNRLFHSEQVAKFMFSNTHFPNKKEELYTLGLLLQLPTVKTVGL